VFKLKLKYDGTMAKHKARLVAKGFFAETMYWLHECICSCRKAWNWDLLWLLLVGEVRLYDNLLLNLLSLMDHWKKKYMWGWKWTSSMQA